jgi:uncharacterized protein (TIGR02646 family)
MKHINKNAEPQGFIEWKKDNWAEIEKKYNAGASGDELWSILPSNRTKPSAPNEYSKTDLRTAIVTEQFYTCCYCMAAIKGVPLDTRMEHFLPKETYKPNEVFDYQNLLAACDVTAKPEQQSCDIKKDNKDPNKVTIFSPLQVDCETHFDYKEDGTIIGLTPEGEKTIKNLNLDCSRLRILREKVINAYIIDVWEEDMNANIEIENVITPYFDGEKYVLQPFSVAIARILQYYP